MNFQALKTESVVACLRRWDFLIVHTERLDAARAEQDEFSDR